MAASAFTRIVFNDLSGGRNGVDPPYALGPRQCPDAVNVEWWRTRFASRRNGGAAITLTFSAGGPFAGQIVTLLRHVPGADETLAELWAFDTTGVVGRMAGATTFSAPTFLDAFTGNLWDISGASINGHLELAYKSAQARNHVWDTATVRRCGLAASAAPTAADGGGAGAYAAIQRYYRQRYTVQSSGVTIRRSEPSPSVAFTPSGANANATVTKAAAITEGETHWELEVSLDNVTFYRLATTVVGTTTYADSAATTTYNTNPLSATTGTYTLQKPYKYLAADQNRILGFGSYTTTDKQSRIEFSAVIGSLDVGDEERVDTTTNYFLDLDENDSGAAVGLQGPILGSFIAFKFKEMAQLTPTGETALPYRVDFISKSVGAVTDRAIVRGEDADGNPCLYFMSIRGPYRWGVKGLEYIGHNIEDLILGPTSQIYSVAGDNRLAHTLYYADKRQVWFFFTTAISSYATLITALTPVAYWRFEEAAGNAADSSGNAHTATASAGIGYHQTGALQDGSFSYSFDGATTSLDAGTSTALNIGKSSAFTVEFWAAPSTTGADQYVIARNYSTNDGSLTIYFRNLNGALHVEMNNSSAAISIETALSYVDGVMRYFVVTWDGTTNANGVKIYVNTILAAQNAATATGATVTVASHFFIGVDTTGAAQFYKGRLDELALYSSAMSTDTMAAHYLASLNLSNRTMIVYHVNTGGWSRYTGNLMSAARCSVLFANTLGASMSIDLKPYIGNGSIVNTASIVKMDTGGSDAGDGIQGTITTPAFEPGSPGFNGECGDAILVAQAASGVTITGYAVPDFGAQPSQSGTALLTASSAGETTVIKRLENSALSGATFFQYTIGDAVATTTGWTLERLIVPVRGHEPLS